MVDIVDFALGGVTDFLKFEELACEVLRDEGYIDIKPLGGRNDFGQDAAVERLYLNENRRTRIVFQVTTQETLEAKLRATIKRLDEENVTYSQLVLVTNRPVSTDRQQLLKLVGREQDVEVEVFERKTLKNRLANLANGIFHRYFPDIETQVRNLLAQRTRTQLDTRTLVRSALAFAMSSQADRARTAVLDQLVMSLLLLEDNGRGGSGSIISTHTRVIPGATPLSPEQVVASMGRWAGAGMVRSVGPDEYQATDLALQRAVASDFALEDSGHLLASDVADRVDAAIGTEVDEGTRRLVERNALEALALTFRLLGLEVSSELLGVREARGQQIGSHEAIVQAAERDLPTRLKAIVVASLGELIAAPNEDQATALASYACGYVGASLIEVDPAVRELQFTRMQGKAFVLDTDFLIDCIVVERPVHSVSLKLVRSIIDAGARVVVPMECLTEATDHAARANRTAHFFGSRLFGLSPAQATEQIHNAFAAGWYFACLGRRVPFEDYIRSYHEPSSPVEYFRRLVIDTLPEQVEIGSVETVLGVTADVELKANLSEQIYELLKGSRKRHYRTEDHTRTLAATDAQLYAAAIQYESPNQQTRRERLSEGHVILSAHQQCLPGRPTRYLPPAIKCLRAQLLWPPFCS